MPPKRKRTAPSSGDPVTPKKARTPAAAEAETPVKRSARSTRSAKTIHEDEQEVSEDSHESIDEAADEVSGEELPSIQKGRQKRKSRRKRTPTPPPDLPPHEHYFFQNRPGGLTKTSANTLSSLSLITHEEYYDAVRKHVDPHQDEMDYLHHLHSRSFDQWLFELKEGYSLCLFGWGSKRFLISAFAEHIASDPDIHRAKIIMINGYNPSLTVRDILATLASQIPSLKTAKLGSQPTDAMHTVLSALSDQDHRFFLMLHTLDGPNLRRGASQAHLARLSAHPQVHLIASADTPAFAMLWDTALRTEFNFLFHDATTFQPYEAEVGAAAAGGGVVDEVNSLLGRSGRRVHGREGVVFVLRSLTESARRLFGLLLSEVLSADIDSAPTADAGAGADADQVDEFERAVGGLGKAAVGELGGVEYRALYRKAVQALITGSEMSFRQLLKEFFDHQMVTSRRDGMGMEILGLPFRREECEAILEDLVVEE